MAESTNFAATVIASNIMIIIIIIIIIITRPKLAYGRQGLAGVSLHASGAQLGQKRSDHFSWQTDKHTLHHNVYKSSSSSTSSSPLARVHFKRPPPAAEAPLSSLWSVKNFEEGEECWIFSEGQQFRHSNTNNLRRWIVFKMSIVVFFQHK